MAAPVVEIEMHEVEPGLPEFPKGELPQVAAPSAQPLSRHYQFFDRIVEHNLKYLRIVCKLGILPFEVDVENRRVYTTKSAIRLYVFHFITFVCLLKTLYLELTLAASLLNPDWFQVLHFPLHLGLTFTTFVIEFNIFLRPKALILSTVLLNAVFAKCDRVKSFSRQQLMLAALPIGLTTVAVPMAIGFPFLEILYQFGTLLRAAITEWNLESTMAASPVVYGFLRVSAYATDAFSFLWIVIGATVLLTSQIMILEVLYFWCEDLREKPTRFNLADCYQEMVDMQIIIGFFNQVYENVVFILKAFCFSYGIAAFVTVFWYGFSDSLVMGLLNLYLGIVSLMLYPLIYEKTALISGSMELAKKNLLMATADIEEEKERAFWRRRVKSIRIVCFLCGPRPVERESLPLFYDFFFSNFISVLLTT